MHLMQLGTYSYLNASRFTPRAQQSIVFHFDILLHDARLTHDNEYGYLTDSSKVNKATLFQARVLWC